MINDGTDEIVLKARGRAICRAVDIEEMSRRGVLSGWDVGSVKFGTEEKEITERRTRDPTSGETIYSTLKEPFQKNVSTIEITLVKKTNEGLKKSSLKSI